MPEKEIVFRETCFVVVNHCDEEQPITPWIPEGIVVHGVDYQRLIEGLETPQCILIELKNSTLNTTFNMLNAIKLKSPQSKVITFSYDPSPTLARASYQHETYYHITVSEPKMKLDFVFENAFYTLKLCHQILNLSAATPSTIVPQKRLQVLILDTHKKSIQQLESLLHPTFETTTIRHAYTALDYLKQNPIQLVLLHHAMPGLESDTAVAQIKRINPLIEIIVYSNHTPYANPTLLLSQGACGYFETIKHHLAFLFVLFQAADRYRTHQRLLKLDYRHKLETISLEKRISLFLSHYKQKHSTHTPIMWSEVEQILPELLQHQSFLHTFFESFETAETLEKMIKSHLKL